MLNSPIPCHEIDAAGVIQKVNDAECELLGYTPGELIGHYVWEFVPKDSVHAVRSAIQQKIAHKDAPAVLEREYRRGDGVYILLEIREKVIEGADGQVVGIRTALIDITERKKYYAEMQRSNDRMRFVLNSSARAIVIADALGNIDFMNPAAEALTGWLYTDAVGRALDEICPLRHACGEAIDAFACIKTESTLCKVGDEAILTDRLGSEHPVMGTVSALYNDEEVVVGVTLVVEDR